MKRMTLAIFLFLSFWPSLAFATTILALGERDLTLRADAVVFGTVITTRTVVAPSRGQIATEADFQAYRIVKGSLAAGDVIRLQVPGGTANGIIQVVPGSPRLQPGQLFVAFLNGHGKDIFTPWGMSYGLLPVTRDAAGEMVVNSRSEGLHPVMPAGAPPADRVLAITNEPLEQLLARLAYHLEASGGFATELPDGQGVAK